MDRRSFLKSCAMAATSALTASSTGAGLRIANQSLSATLGTRKPNVIFVLADDLGYGDLGCYGQSKIKTPHLDKMAAEGIRFTDFYSGSTVCAPARCVLMTGLHTGHCYIRGNATLPLRPEDRTVSELFKQTGYATGCCGKWGLGEEGSIGHPNNKGFDFFYGYLNQGHAHTYYTTYLYRNATKIALDGKTYSHDLITDEALKFVEQNKDNPFFLYYAPTIPHADIAVPYDSQFEEYRELGWPETPFPGGGYHAQPWPHAAFAAMITRLDRDLGRLFDLLKRLELDDNTIVMFTSDNGPHKEGGADPNYFDCNGPLKGFKRDLYEGGIREPMIVRWPGKIAPGTMTDHPSYFPDFLPTCCDLIGIEPPATDGISFLPALLGQTQPAHNYLYWEFYEGNGKQAVRQGPWKGVRLNVSNTANPPVEVYNLDTDLGETTNLAASRPDIAAQLKTLMTEAHTRSEASNWRFYGEQPLKKHYDPMHRTDPAGSAFYFVEMGALEWGQKTTLNPLYYLATGSEFAEMRMDVNACTSEKTAGNIMNDHLDGDAINNCHATPFRRRQ